MTQQKARSADPGVEDALRVPAAVHLLQPSRYVNVNVAVNVNPSAAEKGGPAAGG